MNMERVVKVFGYLISDSLSIHPRKVRPTNTTKVRIILVKIALNGS